MRTAVQTMAKMNRNAIIFIMVAKVEGENVFIFRREDELVAKAGKIRVYTRIDDTKDFYNSINRIVKVFKDEKK